MKAAWLAAWIAAALLILLFIAFVVPARAAPLSDMQAATIYALAHSVSHMPLPQHPPEIHTTSKDALLLLASKICPNGCDVKAMQIGKYIYLDETLDMQDPMNAAILFHEMIHYFQWSKDGEAESCEEWVAREEEAYELQNEVLRKAGLRLVKMPRMSCS